MIKKHTAYILAIAFLLSGCVTKNASTEIEPPIRMNHQEFVSGVAYPAFHLLTAIGVYYVQEGTIPDRGRLQNYSSKFREPIDWQRFGRLEVSEANEEIIVHVDINSLSRSEQVISSWKFYIKKTNQMAQSMQFSVSPQSLLCVQGERTASDVVVDVFLAVAVSYLTKTTVSMPSPGFCFHPSSGKPDVTNDKVQRKMENIKKRLQDKQRSQ
jgi:hypothetical protein